MDFSYFLPILVTLSGIYLLFKLKFFFIRHPIRTIKELLSGLSDRDARRAFFLALSGTLGVGNIFGVAAGIMIGGEGALFWIFLSSIFSCIIKYAEVNLVFAEKIGQGGMAELIAASHSKGRLLSPLYAGLTVGISLFMGAAMQSAAVCDIADQTVGIDPTFCSMILVILLLPAVFGGAKKIEDIAEIIIPLTTIIYIIMCFCVIFVNFTKLPSVILGVMSSALSLKSLAGGTLALAVKEGFARGILSNEAGVGTSALAHARHTDRSPHIAGLFGMCEVFFDTTVLCTLTGLSILLSVDDFTSYSSPMALVFSAFRLSLGRFSALLLPLIFSFAYATLICWFFYGAEYCRLYFGGHKRSFTCLFLAFVIFSRLLPARPLLYVTDIILLFMAFMTLSVMIRKVEKIKKELPS